MRGPPSCQSQNTFAERRPDMGMTLTKTKRRPSASTPTSWARSRVASKRASSRLSSGTTCATWRVISSAFFCSSGSSLNPDSAIEAQAVRLS